MRIAFTADIHIGVPSRLEDIIWALTRVRDYCILHGITEWYNLGDLFHDRDKLDVRDLCTITLFLKETRDRYHINLMAFPGNHDMFLRNSWEINSLIPLGDLIKCYNSVSVFKKGGVRFWVVPFMHYESQYMSVIKKIETSYRPGDVLLTHIGVKSSILNTCFMLKSWSVVEFATSKFDRVYTGHFHTQQQVEHNLWYPGSIIPFKFDEGDVDHGFYVFDTETRTHEFISIWSGEKDDKTPPQFMTFDDSLISAVNSDDVQGNIIRIALTKEYTSNQLLEIRTHINALGAREVRWMKPASKEETESALLVRSKATSASELFVKCLEDDDTDGVKELDKAVLLGMNAEAVAEGDRRYELTGDPDD